jgi:undecaprenyl-diphosphatase
VVDRQRRRLSWGVLKTQTLQILIWLVRARRLQAIVFLSSLSIVLLILSLIVHMPEVNQLDQRITTEMQLHRSQPLTVLATAFTFMGNTITLIGLALIAALYMARHHRPRAAWFAVLMLIGLPLNELLKHVVGRARPEDGIVQVILPAVGLSFPSGHAMASTMVYGFMAVMAWITVADWRRRLSLTVLFSLLVVGIGASRIYLGVHWFSDVMGGFTAGLLLLTLVIIWYRRVGEEAVADAT